jgi:hypothetical protein
MIKAAIFRIFLSLCLFFGLACQTLAWTSQTHILIAREAGLDPAWLAPFPDLSRNDLKEFLGPFHWHNAAPDTVVTPQYLKKFKTTETFRAEEGTTYNKDSVKVPVATGILYWRILDLHKEMKKMLAKGFTPGKDDWQRYYYLGTIAHFLGDLSQPLHNCPYGSEKASDGEVYQDIGAWAEKAHKKFDEALDWFPKAPPEEQKVLKSLIQPIIINSPQDLEREVCKIANSSIALARTCYQDKKRIMKPGEALEQAAMSISLLKAIIADAKGGQ